MSDTNVAALLWSIALLTIPLWMAIPARIIWRHWVGSKIQDEQYRQKVKQILDGGYSLEQFRASLDDERRKLHIDQSKAKLIETDILYPLSITHFLLLPALIVSPLAILLAMPFLLFALPMIMLFEWLLIDRKILIKAMSFFQKQTKWQVIHIPQPRVDHSNLQIDLISFHRMPRASFLGMFAWLIIHWVVQSEVWWLEVLFFGLLYLGLLAVIEVVTTAMDSELIFADPAGSRLIPIDKWIENFIRPLIGAGLIFLLSRNLMDESRSSEGDPILFSLQALLVLFSVTIVGFGVEVGFSRRRGGKVRELFSRQVVSTFSPLSYNFTRHSGRLELHVACSMEERRNSTDSEFDEPRKHVNYTFIEDLRSTSQDGKPIIPPKIPGNFSSSKKE